MRRGIFRAEVPDFQRQKPGTIPVKGKCRVIRRPGRGTARAFELHTVIPVLRRLFAVLAVVALVGPTGVALCASAVEHECQAATMHACCDGPRLSDCRCDDSDEARRQSEPAQQSPRVKADTTPVAVVFEGPAPDPARLARNVSLDASPPPGPISERLSLLSTLLV